MPVVAQAEAAADARPPHAGAKTIAIEDDPAYLLFHYPHTVPREDQVIFTEGAILAEVNVMMMMLGHNNILDRELSIKADTDTGSGSQKVLRLLVNKPFGGV